MTMGFDPLVIAAEMEELLWKEHLDRWFPACIDDSGFHQAFDRHWDRKVDARRSLVFQSRMTWACATVAEVFPNRAAEFGNWARHGADFLWNSFWGAGFDTEIDIRTGEIDPVRRTYGQVFGLFALSAAARVLKAPDLLRRARAVFEWLEQEIHDSQFGGYFDHQGRPKELKLQNTHLHVLEALLELHRIDESALVEERAKEVARLFLDQMYAEPGCLFTGFHRDWTPLPRAWEPGHDLEAAYLLFDVADRFPELAYESKLKAVNLVHHTVSFGFDAKRGGFWELGQAMGRPLDRSKGWWTQCEGIHALAYAWARTRRFADELALHWSWIRDHQFDSQYGGVFGRLTENGELMDDGSKGHAWKAAYHDTRALLNSISELRRGTMIASAPS